VIPVTSEDRPRSTSFITKVLVSCAVNVPEDANHTNLLLGHANPSAKTKGCPLRSQCCQVPLALTCLDGTLCVCPIPSIPPPPTPTSKPCNSTVSQLTYGSRDPTLAHSVSNVLNLREGHRTSPAHLLFISFVTHPYDDLKMEREVGEIGSRDL